MRILPAALVVIATSVVARADDFSPLFLGPTESSEIAAVRRSMELQYEGGGPRVDANVGIGSDLDVPVALTGSIDAGYDLPLCRVVGIGASGLLGYDEGDRLSSWTGSGTLCLPLPANTITFTLTHGQNVRSSLFARQETIRDRETLWRGDLHARFFRLSYEKHTVDIADSDIAIEWVRGANVPGALTLHTDMVGYRWTTTGGGVLGDRSIGVFVAEVEGAFTDDSNHNSNVLTFAPVRLDHVHLGDHVAISGAVGFTGAYVQAGGMQASRIDMRTYGDVSVETDLGVAIAGLGGTRTDHALFDGQIMRDDRLAATLRRDGEHWSARAEGYLARQQVLREASRASFAVGGGALEAGWKFMAPFTATVRTEAGRTITAATAMEPVTAEWDVRAMLSVSASYSTTSR